MKNIKINNNWLVMLLSLFIVSFILYNTYVFVENFKTEEKTKMELWSLAIKDYKNPNLEISNLTLEVLEKNETTPMILVDINGKVVDFRNIDGFDIENSNEINKLIKRYENENDPIKIDLFDMQTSTLYYGNSDLLNKLKFYPAALLLISAIFGFIAFLFFRSSKIAEMNLLWSGMAKETAHQIGTPLTSLMGWMELLKNKPKEENYLKEIEKDLERLNVISERFNKIGSTPKLIKANLNEEIGKTIDYLSARLSKKINLKFENTKQDIYVNLNNQLFSWSLENIIKNSIDSIKKQGEVTVSIEKDNEYIKVYIKDNGVGIKKSVRNKIFNPGVTTKERGWGLGLSLTKRIIEEYHKGEIKVEETSIGQGTKMMIKLRGVE